MMSNRRLQTISRGVGAGTIGKQPQTKTESIGESASGMPISDLRVPGRVLASRVVIITAVGRPLRPAAGAAERKQIP